MKKWTTIFMGVMLTAALAGCGNNEKLKPSEGAATAAPAGNAAPEASASAAPAEQTSDGVPSVEDLIKKTVAASDQLKSFEMESQVKQKINVKTAQGDNAQDTDMTTKSKFIKEPLTMHQEILMKTAQGDQKIEQYVTKDGFYSQTNGAWMKLPATMGQQVITAMQQSTNPEKQLEQFKAISEKTKITEDGDNYMLAAEVSGDDVKELAKTYMNQTGGSDQQMAAMMEQMNIKTMNIAYAVDKKTYFPTRTEVTMVMDMINGDQTISIDMDMKATISDHNKVDEIKIPQEALDAKEVEMPSAPSAPTTP
ncbi:DUF6612 family protein [Paenibacillus sp. FSL R7-0337]|uniref:DUF6612 family protein n=1 Tax=Paenibacillus sp. FSL R7-0337 TaxID=1926588 RepID=UPI00096C75A2|nr:DUF6612 family protein [Paenibacillus sp. FSL R7-0337]OMF95437.1 hypothetical protein BK147_14345 [Paenibacillus sp. FSL R7-0337]